MEEALKNVTFYLRKGIMDSIDENINSGYNPEKFKEIKQLASIFPFENPELKKKYKLANMYEKAAMVKEYLDGKGVKIEQKEMKQTKNNEMAKELRTKGNELFKEIKYEEALDLYNESICYAFLGSEDLGIGYANRSAVYFAMGLYEECLKSIEWAKSSNYPQRLMPKLLEREQNCLAKTKSSNKKSLNTHEFKLSYPANEKIPFIVDCLELKYSKEYGRGLFASRDLRVGDVLMIEDNFVYNLEPEYIFKRCSYCLMEKRKNLIPCDSCTKIMFCSKDCKDKAFEEFHQYDCEMIDGMLTWDVDLFFYTTKIIWIALKAFKSVDDWIKYFETTDKDKIHNLKIDFRNLTWKNMYKSILGLVPRVSFDITVENLLNFTTFTLHKMILQNRKVNHLFQTKEQQKFLHKIIMHLCWTKEVNSHDLRVVVSCENWNQFIEDKSKLETIGGFIGPISSLFNHSCAPSLFYVHMGKTFVVYAIRPIKKGEQLFVSYG